MFPCCNPGGIYCNLLHSSHICSCFSLERSGATSSGPCRLSARYAPRSISASIALLTGSCNATAAVATSNRSCSLFHSIADQTKRFRLCTLAHHISKGTHYCRTVLKKTRQQCMPSIPMKEDFKYHPSRLFQFTTCWNLPIHHTPSRASQV
jgi:hypothetical protein